VSIPSPSSTSSEPSVKRGWELPGRQQGPRLTPIVPAKYNINTT